MGDGTDKVPAIHRWPLKTDYVNPGALERARKIVTQSEIAILNNSKGLAAEVVAKDWVRSAYQGRANLVAVMKRPNRVDVLDLVFETGRGEFVVVEAKASDSSLGRTGERVIAVGAPGEAQIVKVAEDVEQMSPRWFEQRLEELRGKYGSAYSRRLANRLEHSWRSGKLRPLVVRAPRGALSTELAFEVVDYSDEWNAHVGAQPQHHLPQDRSPARGGTPTQRGISSRGLRTSEEFAMATHEGLLKKELRNARAAAKEAGERAAALERQAVRARGPVATAERNLAEAKLPETKAARAEIVEARRLAAGKLAEDAAEARRLAEQATRAQAQLEGQLAAARKELARLRAGREAEAVRTAAAARVTDAAASRAVDAPFAGTKSLVRGTESASGFSRGTPGPAAATVAGPARERALVKAAETEASAAKLGRLTRVLSLSKRIGKLTVGLYLPLTKLELVLELALYLWEWDQRRRRADEEEWRRIVEFLFGFAEPIADPFVGSYAPSLGSFFWSEVSRRLNSPGDPENMVHWIDKWDREERWLGFVYAGVSTELIRNVHAPHGGSATLAPNPVRYFSGAVVPQFKRFSLASSRTKRERETRTLPPEHGDNLLTRGRSGDPLEKGIEDVSLRSDYLYRDVRETKLHVEIVAPTPALTPFDYLAFKCRDLMVEILRFISKFDESFFVNAPFENATALFTTYWYEGVRFPAPIDSARAHRSLKELHRIAQQLEMHTPLPEESPDVGWERRLRLTQLGHFPNSYRRPLYQIALDLNLLASNLDYRAYRPRQDPELEYLTNETLYDAAISIETGFKRIYADMATDRKGPRAHEYRYTGSFEPRS